VLPDGSVIARGPGATTVSVVVGALVAHAKVVVRQRVAGNAIGGGTGRTIATVGGVILGALAGNAVENRAQTNSGLEITVRLDNGETRVVAQEADVPVSVGQRVQVISGAGPTRVTPM
jgi:outer membrane lipoprotein SlyB